jgi:hypothetical protein
MNRDLSTVSCGVAVDPGWSPASGLTHGEFNRPGGTIAPHNDPAADRADAAKKELLLQEWLAEPAIKALLTRIKKLPTIPKLHAKIVEELQSPNGSLEIAYRESKWQDGRISGARPVVLDRRSRAWQG